MQNLIQLEDEVKGLPDQALQQLAQTPNAQLPQFLVVSEIQRRSDMRKRYESREDQPQGTVAQQIVNPQPQGIASMMPQQAAPQGGPMTQPPMQQPMQPPMQQPMQQLAGAPTGQPMPPQTMGMYGGGIVSMLEGRKATFPMNEVPQQSSIIGQRINNPFNIRQANQGFVGESGDESGFVSFDDPMYGVRAADRVLSTYGRDYGINSIRGLLNRYAPPEDDNDTESYISYVSNKLGVDPDAEIDLSNPEVRSQVLSPIAMFESRSEYSPGQITEMIASANEKQGDSGQSQFSMPTPNIDVSAQPPAGLASDLPEFQPRQMRKGVVTTESIPQELDPLSDRFIQNQIQKDLMDSAKRSAQRDIDKVEAQNPQTPSELMTALFGSQSRAGNEKEAASERLLEMADKVNVDTKGLITTDNQPNNAIKEDASTGAGAAGPMGKEVVADVVRDLSQMPLANRLAMERKGQTAGTSDDERRMQQAQRYASLIQGGPSARRGQTGDSAEALAAQLAARESELSPQETTRNNLGDVADQMKQAYMQPDEAGTLGSPDSTPGVKGVYERLIEQFESKTPEASAIEERAEVVSQIQRGYASQRGVEERAARVGGVVDPEMRERSDASMLRLSERLSKLDSQIESGDFSEPEAPQKPLSDSELALIYGGRADSGMAIAEREKLEDDISKPQGTYNQVKRQEKRANKIALAEKIDKKQVEIQAYRDDYDTTNPAVIKEVAKREAEIARLSRELGSLSGAEQKGGDDAQAVDPEKAAVTQTADEASSAAMDQAAAFLAQAKAQREAGLITKEDLAKKEALGAALIQLGAGIAGGDLAGGLSKAGIAAQDVREKARDRALRAKYYDSVATNRSSSSQTLEQKRIIDNVDAGMEGYLGPDGKLAFSGSPEYQAERTRRILEQGTKQGIDMSSYTSSAMPADPTASAAGRATPGESVSFSDLQPRP